MSSREQKYLLGAGIANSRKLLQRFLCLSERPLQDVVEISVEFLQGDLRYASKFFDSRGGPHSTKTRNFEQGFLVSHHEFRRRQSGSPAKSVEGLLSAFGTQKICDVFEQN